MKSWKVQIITTLLCLITMACGSSGHDQVKTLAEAKALAAENNKKILVQVSTVGCADCEKFNRSMKESAKVREALDKVVFLDLSVASEEGKRLAEINNIRTYPTYLLLNDDETVIHSWYGFFGALDWVKTFDVVLQK